MISQGINISSFHRRLAAIVLPLAVMASQSTSQTSIFRDDVLQKAFQSSNTEFTVDVYKRLIPMSSDGNLFYSPFSISVAMSMVYMGAREQTAAQMVPALSLQSMGQRVHEAYEDYLKVIMSGDENVTLRTANRLYPNIKADLVESFFELCGKHYKADVKAVNFDQHEEARLEINEWVSEQTVQKIKDLLPPGSLNPLTVMVLVNAIYFKGNWDSKFDEKVTESMPFNTLDRQQKTVKMMFKKGTKFPLKHDDGLHCTVLELPYKGKQLSMLILLPDDNYGLPALEENLTPTALQELGSDMWPTKVDLYLPKFKLEAGFELSKLFHAMGMTDLFHYTKADLSGIDASKMTYVSAIFHKAFVDVNEEGTEAAAATAVVMMERSLPMPPLQFKADHPFMFIIRDNRSSTILFAGRFVGPPIQSPAKDEL